MWIPVLMISLFYLQCRETDAIRKRPFLQELGLTSQDVENEFANDLEKTFASAKERKHHRVSL